MNIRFATQNDLEQIVEIFNQAIENGNSNAYTEKITTIEKQQWFMSHTNQYFILIVEEDASIIGWTSISPYRKERQALSSTAEISYYIHNDYQRKGIGKLLVNEAINLAVKKGIKNLFAIMLDTNEASKNLLLSIGFQVWGHLPNIVEFPEKTCGQYYLGKKL